MVPPERIRVLNQRPLNPQGRHVLYWMTAARRSSHNFGLQRAAELSRELDRPLLVLEALRADYPFASRRLHAFVMQGMADNLRAFAKGRALYHPYLEPASGAGKGLLEVLAEHACAVVADDFPAFFLPRMLAAVASRLAVGLEAVDSCGLLPLAATPKAFPSAHQMRRFMHRHLPTHLGSLAEADPLRAGLPAGAALPAGLAERWPAATAGQLRSGSGWLANRPLDHSLAVSPLAGGSQAAGARLRAFVANGLARYAEEAKHPLSGAASGLSPYLHFGHISTQEVFLAVAGNEGWAPHLLNPGAAGHRQGFWGLTASAEAFLDQLVTWRELGYHFCRHRPDHESFSALPDWAQHTLRKHARHPRAYVYGPEELLAAATHDPIWNAAQRQLAREGIIPNYLRMLWGKKILHWAPDPRSALAIMLELNNRLALDGRDPNSISGILWCLGLFDRPWGPERPVFGRVRYMTSENAARKLRLKQYLDLYGPESGVMAAASDLKPASQSPEPLRPNKPKARRAKGPGRPAR